MKDEKSYLILHALVAMAPPEIHEIGQTYCFIKSRSDLYAFRARLVKAAIELAKPAAAAAEKTQRGHWFGPQVACPLCRSKSFKLPRDTFQSTSKAKTTRGVR